MALINDKRLTPTMDRVRNGATQMFREKDKNDRSFISSKNCDVSLTHENKEMYADLIDGEWYWVSGCGACLGEGRSFKTYIECEKHDICRSCGISRKDITSVAWGGRNGWQCQGCKDVDDAERRTSAFEKLDGGEPNCLYMDNVICPHCGSELNSNGLNETQDMECYVCEGEMLLEVEHVAVYSTYVKGKRVVK